MQKHKRITRTGQYMTKLQSLQVGKSIRLIEEAGSYQQRALWRHAANKLGQRIMIRTLPSGVWLHRLG